MLTYYERAGTYRIGRYGSAASCLWAIGGGAAQSAIPLRLVLVGLRVKAIPESYSPDL